MAIGPHLVHGLQPELGVVGVVGGDDEGGELAVRNRHRVVLQVGELVHELLHEGNRFEPSLLPSHSLPVVCSGILHYKVCFQVRLPVFWFKNEVIMLSSIQFNFKNLTHRKQLKHFQRNL